MAKGNRYNFMKHVNINSEEHPYDSSRGRCWYWTGSKFPTGYGQFWWIDDDGKGYSEYAHRAAYMIFKGDIKKENYVIRHSCDRKICCNPDHLDAGSHKDNSHDMISRGLYPENRVRRFYFDDADEMKQLYKDGYTQREIAEVYQCSQPHVSQIVNGKILNRDKRGVSRVILEDIKKLYCSGVIIAEIADKYNKTWNDIYQMLKVRGWLKRQN
jgi:Mor family transcriptional regulator